MNFLIKHWRRVFLLFVIVPFFLYLLIFAWTYYMWGDEMTDIAWADYIRRDIRLEPYHVDGTSLPPEPSVDEVDATIPGVDRNRNTIRDDVELKIFKLYPGTEHVKERAVALQYAQSEQIIFTWVVGKQSMEAYLEKSSRSFLCVSSLFPSPVPLATLPDKEADAIHYEISKKEDAFGKAVVDFVLNNDARRSYRKDTFHKYMTGSSTPDGDYCDLTFRTKNE